MNFAKSDHNTPCYLCVGNKKKMRKRAIVEWDIIKKYTNTLGFERKFCRLY